MKNQRARSAPRIEALSVKNYRVLRDVRLEPLAPLTTFLGPNGSGKTTLMDVFAFLAECFSDGLRKAWDRRGRFDELRSRGSAGPIVIELRYCEQPSLPSITYHLTLDEGERGPRVVEEWLEWQPDSRRQPFRMLEFKDGSGDVVAGDRPDEQGEQAREQLASLDTLAVGTLGQLARYPRVAALRQFIAGWYLSDLTGDRVRGGSKAGPQERLSTSGNNLPNVIQYLSKQHPERLRRILQTLSRRVPRLEKVEAKLVNGRLRLQVRDVPFEEPISADFISEGTLKMLAYLVVLYDPDPPPLIGIEEPENHLHPRLLQELAEECRAASAHSQVLVTSHSPFFVNGLRPEEVWVLYRDERGYTQARRAADMRGVKEFMSEGALLGDLWVEGHFEAGDPLSL